MKKRASFVSNSSSASFLIPKALLTAKQIDLIKNHINSGFEQEYFNVKNDKWSIEESETQLTGTTWMTNFNMKGYFDYIGITNASLYFDDEEDDEI